MLVSFYAQIFIISTSLLIVLLPFLGFPQSWNNALTAILGLLVFGTGIYALYDGYSRILKKEEKRLQSQQMKRSQIVEQDKQEERGKEDEPLVAGERNAKSEKIHDYTVLQTVRD